MKTDKNIQERIEELKKEHSLTDKDTIRIIYEEAYKTGIQETLAFVKEEIDKLKHWIELEIPVAEKAKTNNGEQSVLIYNLVLIQLNKLKSKFNNK